MGNEWIGSLISSIHSISAEAWGTIAGAIGTFLAVIVALFKEEIVKVWRRPKLTGIIRLKAPDCHKTEMVWGNPSFGQVTDRSNCYYFRIWVENKGWQRAERVQVFAAKLLRNHADGTFREEKAFLPMNLRWSHSHEIYADGISHSMGRHCDLGHIMDPKKFLSGEILSSVSDDKTILALDLEVQPNTLSHLLEPATYQLHLQLAAANAAPIKKRFEITLTGKWFDEENKMFSDGIGIKEV